MSRFAQRSRFVALGLLGLGMVALSAPALADATPARSGESCSALSLRSGQTCRVAARPRARTALLEAQELPVGIVPYLPTRYVSLLILGVGY